MALAVEQECTKDARVHAVPEGYQEGVRELKGRWELLYQLVDAVQEKQKDWGLVRKIMNNEEIEKELFNIILVSNET